MRGSPVMLLLLAGVVTTAAAAQNELGAGNVLDANPAFGASPYNLAIPMPDFRSRNLLVTGNVAGGRGFRGTVGYTAEYDFRDETGSDDLFAERAGAAFSAPSFITAGRSMEQVRFGQYLNEIEYRRATRGATTAGLGERPYLPTETMISQRIALDRIAISSTTSAILESAADAQIIGLLQESDGRRLTASTSSLLGVRIMPVEQQVQLIGLDTYDMVRAVDDARSGREPGSLGAPFELRFADLKIEGRRAEDAVTTRVEPEVEEDRMEPGLQRSYLKIMDRVARRYAARAPAEEPAAEPGLIVGLDEQFDALRRVLAERETAEDAEAGGETAPGASLLPETTEGIEPEEIAVAEATAVDALADPLRHGELIDRLASDDQTRFNELMAAGEQSLSDGEYFWAERRFERALRFTPGHPLATAGKGHAQIGAGLYGPAALTLRRLLTAHPEMIDVRYDDAILPARVRLNTAVARIRELIDMTERDQDLNGFLLAYLGHQLADRGLVAEGLAAMDESPLRDLLNKVWLTQE